MTYLEQQMKEQTHKDATDLITALENPSIDDEVERIREQNRELDLLRSNIFEFFRDRMRRISSQESLKERVQVKLLDLVDGDELDFDQLTALLRNLNASTRDASSSIIDLFKPSPGTNSILADTLGKPQKEQDDLEEFFDHLSSEELEKLNKFYNEMRGLKQVRSED